MRRRLRTRFELDVVVVDRSDDGIRWRPCELRRVVLVGPQDGLAVRWVRHRLNDELLAGLVPGGWLEVRWLNSRVVGRRRGLWNLNECKLSQNNSPTHCNKGQNPSSASRSAGPQDRLRLQPLPDH